MAINKSMKLSHMHLGDMINVIQCHFDSKAGIFCDETCHCCQKEVRSTLIALLDVFRPNLTYQSSSNATLVYPSWECDEKCPVYRKLPERSKKPFVACHFDANSGSHYKEIGDRLKSKIINKLSLEVVNIGARPIADAKNMHDATLLQKIEIIASAQLVIGIDDGIAHLAECTHGENIIIQPKGHKKIHMIYPKEAKIIKTEDLLDVL
jgi:hypothetical protein